jgi:hypothetical protein
MSALPVYEVEFIPLERRLSDRRTAPSWSALPQGLKADRRKMASGRRKEDTKIQPLKSV